MHISAQPSAGQARSPHESIRALPSRSIEASASQRCGDPASLRLHAPAFDLTTQIGYQAAVLLLLILISGAPSNTLAGIRRVR